MASVDAAHPKDIVDPVKHAVAGFEQAAKHKDPAGADYGINPKEQQPTAEDNYNAVMKEVNQHLDELKSNPDGAKAYVKGIRDSLDKDGYLPVCELMELKSEMSGEASVSQFDVRLLQGQKDINELQKGFLADVPKLYEKLNPTQNQGFQSPGFYAAALKAEIDSEALKLQNKDSLEHLFDKRVDGTTLYDHLSKDSGGNIKPRAISALLGDPTLSDKDKESLNFLFGQRNSNWYWSNDLDKAQMQQLLTDNNSKIKL